MRVTEIKNGLLITIGNNQDYRQDDEWVNQSYYFAVAFFDGKNGNRAGKLSEGDIVLVSGAMNTRVEGEGDEKRTYIGLVGFAVENFGPVSARSESSEKPKSKSKSPAKSSSKPSKRDASHDDDDDDDLDLFD